MSTFVFLQLRTFSTSSLRKILICNSYLSLACFTLHRQACLCSWLSLSLWSTSSPPSHFQAPGKPCLVVGCCWEPFFKGIYIRWGLKVFVHPLLADFTDNNVLPIHLCNVVDNVLLQTHPTLSLCVHQWTFWLILYPSCCEWSSNDRNNADILSVLYFRVHLDIYP